LLTLRLSGHYLPLGTIAWGISLYFLFGNLEFLGGHTGISGIPPLAVRRRPEGSGREFYYLIWAVLLLACWLTPATCSIRARAAPSGPQGRLGDGRGDGGRTPRSKHGDLPVAALFACVSGWLYAHLQRFVNPTPFGLNIGIEYLFMAVGRRRGHVWGAMLGAGVITVLKQWLQDWLPKLLGRQRQLRDDRLRPADDRRAAARARRLWPILQRCRSRSGCSGAQRSSRRPLPRRPCRARGGAARGNVAKRFGGLVANNNMSLTVGRVR
jgi:ABC-type branched-subunit amino acid transport system permease subunit